jgi:hypothetical protein
MSDEPTAGPPTTRWTSSTTASPGPCSRSSSTRKASPEAVADVLRIATPAELREARRRLAEARGDAEAAVRAIRDQLDAMVTESPALKSVGRRGQTEL